MYNARCNLSQVLPLTYHPCALLSLENRPVTRSLVQSLKPLSHGHRQQDPFSRAKSQNQSSLINSNRTYPFLMFEKLFILILSHPTPEVFTALSVSRLSLSRISSRAKIEMAKHLRMITTHFHRGQGFEVEFLGGFDLLG